MPLLLIFSPEIDPILVNPRDGSRFTSVTLTINSSFLGEEVVPELALLVKA
jgi:hypothetical protein